MAYSIIESYKKVWQEVKDESVAEWFGIYPFVEPHFGEYKAGEYVNGAVLPLVGGELDKAVLKNSQGKYAVDILQRLDKIMNINNRKLPSCVNHDGTAQSEAVPGEWGQAAFVSALVEGLAGVVDKGIKFNKVEISPRWYFAGVNETSVEVGYGDDGNQVLYTYAFTLEENKVRIETRGVFENFVLRVPFSIGTKLATITLNGENKPMEVNNVNDSKYVVIEGKGSLNHVTIQFK